MGKDGEITSQQTEPEAIHVPAQYLQNVSSLQEYLQKVCLFCSTPCSLLSTFCFALEVFQFQLLEIERFDKAVMIIVVCVWIGASAILCWEWWRLLFNFMPIKLSNDCRCRPPRRCPSRLCTNFSNLTERPRLNGSLMRKAWLKLWASPIQMIM